MKTATHPEELSSRAHGKDSASTPEAPSTIARQQAGLLGGSSINGGRLGDHRLNSTIVVLAYLKHSPAPATEG